MEDIKQRLGINSLILRGLSGVKVAEAVKDYQLLNSKIVLMRQGVSGELFDGIQELEPEVKQKVIELSVEHQAISKKVKTLEETEEKARLLQKLEQIQSQISTAGFADMNLGKMLEYKPNMQKDIDAANQAKLSQLEFILANLSEALGQSVDTNQLKPFLLLSSCQPFCLGVSLASGESLNPLEEFG